jgi:N-acetylmuramoyl-L-alanine amidase
VRVRNNGRVVRRVIAAAAVALLAPPAAGAAPLICLDPGHARRPNLTTEPIGPGSTIRKIKDGGGASGEAPVVLAIGLKLRSVLLDRGYRVAMTRTGPDFTLGGGGNVDRAKFCNRRAAALMIRIHADGSSNPRTHGVSTLYPAWRRGWTSDIYRPSLRAARIVHRNVLRTTGAANRGLVARSDLTGFNWANVPVILVETGFMTNPTERRRLQSAAYQWRVARGLAAGTRAFVPPS